ncbi:MAG: hypothetical protein WCI77_00495 [Candidatus Omnitrophota bacterium]
MSAEFLVASCHYIDEVGTLIGGEVLKGRIEEGEWGATASGKKFLVSKMEFQGDRRVSASEHEKVNLYAIHISQTYVRAGDTLYFY